MLQFTDLQTNTRIWVNPAQVSAVTQLKPIDTAGSVLLMAGGFEIQVQQTAEEVSAQINKRLSAY